MQDQNQQPNTANPVSQPTQLDPQAVNLAKAIRQTESGGDFTATGKSGEYGAYQFTPDTWTKYSQEVGVNVPLDQATPSQQNQVAYTKIKQWKDAGNNVGQIASMWNAGEDNPNAYQDPNFKGTNAEGANYNVADYAKSVATAYQTLKSGGQVGADPNNPSSTASTQNQPNTYGATFPSSPTDNPLTAGLKAVGNIPSSLYNFGSSLFNAILHPVKTVEGLGNVVAGGAEEGYNALTGGQKPTNTQTQTFDALVSSLKDRYGSLENLQRTATNDPMGFGADVLSILYGGASLADLGLGAGVETEGLAGDALKAAQEANAPVTTALGKGISAVGSPIASVVKAPFQLAKNATTGLLGGLTGTGGAVRTAYEAGAGGMESYKSFLQGLRGNVSGEDLVNQAKSALGDVVAQRNATYQDMLAGLKGDATTYDISPIENEIQKQLKNFNITQNSDGTLDFSRSRIRFNTSAQSDIQQIVDTMKNFGTRAGDRTAIGINGLKQAFYELDSPSSPVRAFTTGVSKATRGILEDAPGYTDTMKNYSDITDSINAIQKGLSLGDKAQVETSFNKLMSAVRGSNPIKKQLLGELNQVTGGTLIPQISGSMLSSWTSKGILAHLAEIGGVYGLATGTGIVPLLVSLMSTSPKLVGALVSSLGLSSAGVSSVMNILNKGVLVGNALNRVSSPTSPAQNSGLLSQLQGR